MGIPVDRIAVDVEGKMDLRGTLGVAKEVPVGFQEIVATFDVQAPNATAEQLAALREKTEQYCVVMRTLAQPPEIKTSWIGTDQALSSEI